jgi:hypothetical protein
MLTGNADSITGEVETMDTAVRDEINAALDGLPEENLRALLEVLRQMKGSDPAHW